MNIKDCNALIESVKDSLEDACLSSAVISYKQASSIASYKFSDKEAALVSKYTTFLSDMVTKSGMGKYCKYYAINLPDGLMLFVLIFGEYCWATLVDTNVVPLGMIMNSVLPGCIEDFNILVE